MSKIKTCGDDPAAIFHGCSSYQNKPSHMETKLNDEHRNPPIHQWGFLGRM